MATFVAGLPWFRPHDLRHTMATLAIERGQHIKVVQERLGHNSVRTTLEMYAGVLPGMDADLAGWLDGLLPMQSAAPDQASNTPAESD